MASALKFLSSVWTRFPAFIVIDDKGNDFFKELNLGRCRSRSLPLRGAPE
jgi:tartrate dehydratase beta subunit/fumarate hydratase class I family protein